MARSSSFLARLIVVTAALGLASQLGVFQSRVTAFIPPARSALGQQLAVGPADAAKAAYTAALFAAATAPAPVMALAGDDDDEGFDFRILAVLGLPLTAASWALFNVWRVAFRQGARIGEGISGSSKAGLKAED
mmetsp:Transcript_67009/g.143322  ORF Transcript_67009/g.143322 Transcript_67009/m.143322 type:complete len:134 (+) Transcript_67009:75-476(+)